MRIDEELKALLGVIVLIILAISIICAPIVYLDGKAKSVYIKELKGIDLPWYRAAFLKVQIHDVGLNDAQKDIIRQSTK